MTDIRLDLTDLRGRVRSLRTRGSWVIRREGGVGNVWVQPGLDRVPQALLDGAKETVGGALDAALVQYLRFYVFGEGRLGRSVRYDAVVRDESARPRPDTVSFILTKVCNFECPHCYNNSGKRHHNELSLKEKLVLVDYLGRWGIHNLILSGGEPTLDPALSVILQLARNHRMVVKITTNGWKIPSFVYDAVSQRTIRQVNVSLDGATATSHDTFRRKRGSFDRAINSIALFREAKVERLVINSSISSGQIGEMQPLTELALERGASGISFKAVLFSGRNNPLGREVVLTDGEKATFQRERDRLQEVFGGRITVEGGLITDEVPADLLDEVTCNAGSTAMMIDADGGMLPCEIIGPSLAGPNVREMPPAQAWLEAEVFTEFRKVKTERTGGCGTRGCPGCRMRLRQPGPVAVR